MFAIATGGMGDAPVEAVVGSDERSDVLKSRLGWSGMCSLGSRDRAVNGVRKGESARRSVSSSVGRDDGRELNRSCRNGCN